MRNLANFLSNFLGCSYKNDKNVARYWNCIKSHLSHEQLNYLQLPLLKFHRIYGNSYQILYKYLQFLTLLNHQELVVKSLDTNTLKLALRKHNCQMDVLLPRSILRREISKHKIKPSCFVLPRFISQRIYKPKLSWYRAISRAFFSVCNRN